MADFIGAAVVAVAENQFRQLSHLAIMTTPTGSKNSALGWPILRSLPRVSDLWNSPSLSREARRAQRVSRDPQPLMSQHYSIPSITAHHAHGPKMLTSSHGHTNLTHRAPDRVITGWRRILLGPRPSPSLKTTIVAPLRQPQRGRRTQPGGARLREDCPGV